MGVLAKIFSSTRDTFMAVFFGICYALSKHKKKNFKLKVQIVNHFFQKMRVVPATLVSSTQFSPWSWIFRTSLMYTLNKHIYMQPRHTWIHHIHTTSMAHNCVHWCWHTENSALLVRFSASFKETFKSDIQIFRRTQVTETITGDAYTFGGRQDFPLLRGSRPNKTLVWCTVNIV